MSLDLIKPISYSDIPDLIKGKSINDQLGILRDFFGFKNIKKNNGLEGLTNSSIDGLYEIVDSNDKVGLFMAGVGMLELQTGIFFVDEVSVSRNDFELNNKQGAFFYPSMEYIVSYNGCNICGLLRTIGEKDFQKIGIEGKYDFASDDEIKGAIVTFYQQKIIRSQISDTIN